MDEKAPMTLGRTIARARIAQHRSQRELAADLGISGRELNEIERDRRMPNEQERMELVRLLGLDIPIDDDRPDVACPHCHEDIADRMFENVESDEWEIIVIGEWKALDTDDVCPYCHREYNLRCTYDQVSETVHDIVIEAR